MRCAVFQNARVPVPASTACPFRTTHSLIHTVAIFDVYWIWLVLQKFIRVCPACGPKSSMRVVSSIAWEDTTRHKPGLTVRGEYLEDVHAQSEG